MTTTEKTASSFRAAVLAAIATDPYRWRNPVIYAEDIDGVMVFDAANDMAMPAGAIPWLFVEGDSFCGLTGDDEADADSISGDFYLDAVNDTLDEIDRRA